MTPASSRPSKKAESANVAASSDEAEAPHMPGAPQLPGAPEVPGAPQVPEVDPEIAKLTYEDARDALVDVVRRLEGGAETLEESLALWQRGEGLAQHCERWLDGAQARLGEAD